MVPRPDPSLGFVRLIVIPEEFTVPVQVSWASPAGRWMVNVPLAVPWELKLPESAAETLGVVPTITPDWTSGYCAKTTVPETRPPAVLMLLAVMPEVKGVPGVSSTVPV